MSTLNFQVENGYVLCEPPEPRKTEGGIVIPETETVDNEPVRMKVVQVGTGDLLDNGTRREMDIVPGCYYYFNFPQYALTNRISLGGKRYVLAQAKFVCGREV